MDAMQQNNFVTSALAEENLIMYDQSTQQYVVPAKTDFSERPALFWRLYSSVIDSRKPEEIKKYCILQTKMKEQFEDQLAAVERLRNAEAH